MICNRDVNFRAPGGFALPLVLILLALLTALAMGLSSMATTQMRDFQQRKALWQLEKQAINQLQRQTYVLLTGVYDEVSAYSGGSRIYLDGRAEKRGDFLATVQNASGLYSLGLYQEQRFTEFLKKFVDSDTAKHISAELGDWIDTDSRARFRGMERADYLSAGYDVLPRDAPLRSIEELLYLPSMTPEIFYGANGKPGLRDFALAGGSSMFNAGTAPPEVLGPMLGATRTVEAQLNSAIESGNWEDVRRLVDDEDWVFGGASPFFPGFRFLFTYADMSGNRIRCQVRLTPFGISRLYDLVEWQAPYFENG